MNANQRPEATHQEGPIAYLLETLTMSLREAGVPFIFAIQDKQSGRVMNFYNMPPETNVNMYCAMHDLEQSA